MKYLSIFAVIITSLLMSKFSIGMNTINNSLPSLGGLTHKEVIICSNEWSKISQRCPTDINTFVKSKVTIGDYHVCFDRGCDEAAYSGPTTSIFVIIDGDTGYADSYKVTKSDNIYYKDNNGRPQKTPGYIKIVKQNTTPQEDEAAKLLNSAKKDYFYFARSMNITKTSSGALDANGNSPQIFESYFDSCNTALAYHYNSNNCNGALNRAIRLGVKDNKTFHAFISSANKSSGVISVIVPGLDNIDLNKLSEFKFILNMEDNSRIVLDIKVDQGAVSIKLDKDSSRTVNGQSIDQFLANTYRHENLGSITEANIFGERGIRMCNLKTLNDARGVFVQKEEKYGEIIYLYRIQDNYIVYQLCN